MSTKTKRLMAVLCIALLMLAGTTNHAVAAKPPDGTGGTGQGNQKTTFQWQGAWMPNLAYVSGDAVQYEGSSYLCKLDHVSSSTSLPPDDTTHWELFAAAGESIYWAGEWVGNQEYKARDIVRYEGSSYLCKLDHVSLSTSFPPDDTTHWALLVVQGPAGATGPQGLQGEKGPTGDKGDVGPAGVTGPQGLQGEKGPTGDKGDVGPAGATGPQGLQGEKGPAGTSAWNDGNGQVTTTGSVGIGVTGPAAKLEVNGGIKIANDNSACSGSKAGTIRWTGSSLEVCNGTAWNVLQYASASTPPPSSGNAPSSVEYLVVGGGGGGGSTRGGGGGAGGFITGSYNITVGTPITVTVGAGGNKAVFGSNSSPTNGENSSFGSITALGGGYGGGRYGGSQATVGGSGGGGSEAGGNCLAAAGTSGQGNAGGDCYPTHHGGGGGGAGAVGGTASASSVGDGGTGLISAIIGTATYYAGGGGGGGHSPEAGGGGGRGGGGKGGSRYEHGTDAEANTGGGGGGGGDDRDGGNGGSGVVIIRYPDTFGAAETTGLPSVTTVGGYRIYKWTASGSITFGGTASTSPPPPDTNGNENTCVCGSSNGKSFSNEPTTDLCSSSCNGAINMNYNGSAWTWNCSVSGASDPSCSATKIVSTSLFNADEYKAAKAMQLISIGLYSNRDEALAAFEAAWATKDPYLHYLQFGSKEGINPSNNFDESSYYEAKLAQLQSTNAAVNVPGCPSTWAGRTVSELKACFELNGFTPLTHYLSYGIQEGLPPIPVPSSEQVFPWW